MPGKVKVKVVAGRNLPVMDRSSDTTDAYVEIKLGNTTFKTDVCRKSLNPQWNSEWYRFEMDDAELQDEPLQIRLMDHDTYSANDAIGKVYLDLNPLLLPPVNKSNLSDNSNSQTSSSNLSRGNTMSGWFPVYDTMHGIRGEVNVIVKVELFSDFNKFRQSSCGVQFFNSATIPQGYHAQVVHGMVEELVVSDDPEYQWIDKIRTPRASNEARQTLFFKLSGEVQRRIGLKVLDFGGNAVIGYLQCFDLEAECGIVVRGLGTAVTLGRLHEPSSSLPGQYTEDVIPASPLRHSPSEPRLSVGLLSPANHLGHRSKSPRQTKRLRPPYCRRFSEGVPECDNVSLKVLFEQEDMRGEPVSSRRKIFERLSSFPKRKFQAFRAKSGSTFSRRTYGRSNSENIASSLIRSIMEPTAFSLDRVPETEEMSESKSDSESVVHPLRYDDGHLVPISSSSSDTSSSDVDDLSDVSSASMSTTQEYTRLQNDTDKYKRVEPLTTNSTSEGTYFSTCKKEVGSFYKEEKNIVESEASKPNLFVSSMHIVLTPDHKESAQLSNLVKFHKTLSPKKITLVKKLLRQHSFERDRQKRSDTPPLSDMDPFMTFSLEGKDNYTETIFERKRIVTRPSLDRELKSRPVANLSFPESVRHLPSVSSGYISPVRLDCYEKNVEILSDNVFEHTDKTQNSYLYNPFNFPTETKHQPDLQLFQPKSLIPGSIWDTNKILPCSKNTYFVESCESDVNKNDFTSPDTLKQCPLNSSPDKSENIYFQLDVIQKYSEKQKSNKEFQESEALLATNKQLVDQSAENMNSKGDSNSSITNQDPDIKNDQVISEQRQSIYSNEIKQGDQITEFLYSAIDVKECDGNEACPIADQLSKTNKCHLIPEKKDQSKDATMIFTDSIGVEDVGTGDANIDFTNDQSEVVQAGDATMNHTYTNRVDGAGDQSIVTRTEDTTTSLADSKRVDVAGDQSIVTQTGDATASLTDSNRVDGSGDQSIVTQTGDATTSLTDSNSVVGAGDQSIVTQTGDANTSLTDSNRVDVAVDQSIVTQTNDATTSLTDSNSVDSAGDQSIVTQTGDATASLTDSNRDDGVGDQSIVTQTKDANTSLTDSNRVDGSGDQSIVTQTGDATTSLTDSNSVVGAGDQSIVTQTKDANTSLTDSNRVDSAGDQSIVTQTNDATTSLTDSNSVDSAGDQSIVTQTGDATTSLTDSNSVVGAVDQSIVTQTGDATTSLTDSNSVVGAVDQSIVTQTNDATTSLTDSNRVDVAGDQSIVTQTNDATTSLTDSNRVDVAGDQSIVTQTNDATTSLTDSNRVDVAVDQSIVTQTNYATTSLTDSNRVDVAGDQSIVTQTGDATASLTDSNRVDGSGDQSIVTQTGDATTSLTDSNSVVGAGDQSIVTQTGDANTSLTDSNRVDVAVDQSIVTQTNDATTSLTDSNSVDSAGDQSIVTQTGDATASLTDSNRDDGVGDQSIVTQTKDANTSLTDSNRVDGSGDQSIVTQTGDATTSLTDSNSVVGAGDQSIVTQTKDANTSLTDSNRVDSAGDQSIVTQTNDATTSLTDSNSVDSAGDQSIVTQTGDATTSLTDSNSVVGAVDQSIVTQTGDATTSLTDSNSVVGAVDQSIVTQTNDATTSLTDSNRVDVAGDQSIVTQTNDATTSLTDSNRVDVAGDQSIVTQTNDATTSLTDSNRVDVAVDQSIVTQTNDATTSLTDSNRVDGAGDQSIVTQTKDATTSLTDSNRDDVAGYQSIVTQSGDATTSLTDSNRVDGAGDQSYVVQTGDATLSFIELTVVEGGDQSKVSQTGVDGFIESFVVEGDRKQSVAARPGGGECYVRVEDTRSVESKQKEETLKDQDYLSACGQNVPVEVITPAVELVSAALHSNTDSTKPSLACDASPLPLPLPYHPLVKSRSATGLSTASVLPCPTRTVPEETPAVVVAHHVSPLKMSNTPAIHRRSSDSDLSITPKGNSLTSSGDRSSSGRAFPNISVKLAMKKEPIEGMEFPFLTMNKFPPGFVVHIAGSVTSRSVKLLERVANQEEPEGRDAWWIELRMEVRSHMRAMSCNAVIGYSENTTICDDVCVLSASGTAAVVNVRATPVVPGGAGGLGDTPEPPPPPALPKQLTNMTTSLDRTEFERSSSLAQSTPLKPDSGGGGGGGSGKTRHHSDSMDQPDPLTSSATAAACALCHLPFNPASVPLPVTAIKCAVCGKRKVPDLLLATIEPVEGLPTVGRSCLIHVFVTRPKQHARGEMNACVVSDSLPFIEYDIYKQLVNKLKVNGMNAAFGLKTQICLGERMIAAVLSGTAMFLEPLPPPSTPIITPGESWNQEGKLASLLRGLQETVKKNRDFYQVKTAVPPNQESENTAGGVMGSDTDESEDDLPDIDIHAGNKEACVFMVDDEQDIEVVSQLIDPHPPEGFFVTATEGLPGLDDLEVVRNLQMFTQIWRSRIPSSQPTSSMHKHFHKLLQGIYYKLRRMTPCAVGNIQFRMALPEPDEMQISIVGMALGLGVAMRNPKSVRRRTVGASSKPDSVKKSDDGDMIFSLEEDQETNNSQSTKTAKPKSPIRPKRQSTHLPPKERYGVDITPLSFIPGGRIERYLGNLNFFFIRETSCIREGGGLSGFVHSFVAEVLAIIRAHVTALGGNAMVAFFLNECIILNNPHKNHGQCLINVGGDVVSVSYID